jgi:hypothetical protein
MTSHSDFRSFGVSQRLLALKESEPERRRWPIGVGTLLCLIALGLSFLLPRSAYSD